MDYNDMPMEAKQPETSPYGDISCCDEKCQTFLKKNHDTWTIKQMQAICDYLQDKMSKLREAVNSDLTIEDFEKAKKTDIDADNEEGE